MKSRSGTALACGVVLLSACAGARTPPKWADRVLDDPPRRVVDILHASRGLVFILAMADTCEVDTLPTGDGRSSDGECDIPDWSEEHPCRHRPIVGERLALRPFGGGPDLQVGITDHHGRGALPWSAIPAAMAGRSVYVFWGDYDRHHLLAAFELPRRVEPTNTDRSAKERPYSSSRALPRSPDGRPP